jgi:integrase
MAKDLTPLAVEKAKPGATRREIPDGKLRGLYLVIQAAPSGRKSWAVRYRFHGKPRKLTLIGFPSLPVARELARDALDKLAKGVDPAAEKQVAKRRAELNSRDLVEQVLPDFIEQYAKENTRQSTWQETARVLGLKSDENDPDALIETKSGLLASWKGRRIHEIAKRDILSVLGEKRSTPIMANRTLAAMRRLFNWCVENDIITASPCVGVKPPGAEHQRDRVLSDKELQLLWAACETEGPPFGPLVKLLILTGQRRGEVGKMRWPEVDLAQRMWTLPRARVKNDTAHDVPMSDQAIAVLEQVPRVKGKAQFVFTTTGDTPVSGFTRAKARFDAAMTEAAGDERAIPEWTLHDLRRTAATGMARLGVRLPIIEKVLNHTSGSFAGIVGVYQRHGYADEKRAALDLWGRHVEAIVSGSGGQVIPLQRAARS